MELNDLINQFSLQREGAYMPLTAQDEENNQKAQALAQEGIDNDSFMTLAAMHKPYGEEATSQPENMPTPPIATAPAASSLPQVAASTPPLAPPSPSRAPANKAQELKDMVGKKASLEANPTKDPAPVSNLLSSLLGQNDAQMNAANQQRNMSQLIATLGQAGATIGNAFTPLAQHQDNGFYKQMMELSNEPVQDVMNKQASALGVLKRKELMDQIDPNGPAAQAAAKGYEQMFHEKAPDGISPDALEKISRAYAPYLARKEGIANRAFFEKQRQEEKQSQKDEEIQAKFTKDLSDLTPSSRSAIGRAGQAKISINRLLDIVNDPNATTKDLQSAYADLNAVVSGTTTISGTAHQAYSTAAGQLSDLSTYLTGDTKPADIPGNIRKHVADVARRMNTISDNVINRHYAITSAGRSEWIKRHPERYKDIMGALIKEHGVDLPSEKEKLIQAAQSSSAVPSSSYSADVLDYAKQHGISPEEANQIKLQRGGQ